MKDHRHQSNIRLMATIIVVTILCIMTYSYHEEENRKQKQCLAYLSAITAHEAIVFNYRNLPAKINKKIEDLSAAYKLDEREQKYCKTWFGRTPTKEDIEYLKSNPDRAKSFNNHFGRGEAEKYITE